MAQLQPFVSNIPLQVAKNLRFDDDNKIPVTQMLPIGMNGNVPNDNPRTGYISRIGAVLSDQIDLYNQVAQTLNTYGQNIATLQQEVAALQISGTTVPNVNGFCYTGDAQSPITTVVELMAESTCEYAAVFGIVSDLMEAILAEGATTLNAMQAFSIPGGVMQALAGWIPDPKTLADTVNNLWLSYLDSRDGVESALSEMTPSCSQAIINFYTRFIVGAGTTSGVAVYFSGYSFIPTAYTDNGSIITIKDGVGGIYTTGIDVVARSQPGADPLFVGISGTALAIVPSYTVTLESKIKSSSNSCGKTVVHTTTETPCGDCSSGSTAPVYQTGDWELASVNPSGDAVPTTLGVPSFIDVTAKDALTASFLAQGYWFDYTTPTSVLLVMVNSQASNLKLKWIAYV